MRAHASEGRFFPELVLETLRARRIRALELVEAEVLAGAAARLGRPAARLRAEVAALGKAAGRPWRAGG
jgi:hypothetical protein